VATGTGKWYTYRSKIPEVQ